MEFRLSSYMKPYLRRMSLGFFIKFMGTIMDLLIPWILAHIIDHVAPEKNISLVLFWGGGMILCAFLAVLGNVIANRMASKVSKEITETIRSDLFSKTLSLSHEQVNRFSLPSLVSRLTSDTYHVHNMVSRLQRVGVRAPILLLGGLFVTLTLDFALALTLIAILPFILFVVYHVSKRGIPLFQESQSSVDQMIRVVRENITGIRVIRALSKSEDEIHRFDSQNENVVEKETKVGKIMAITSPMMNLFLNTGLTLVILVGAFRIHQGLSQPGTVIAFLTYFTIILNAMISITRIFVLYSKGNASYQRIREVLCCSEQLILQETGTQKTPFHILFDRVSFSYHKKKENIKEISFGVERGQTLGILGATGSGKSTLVALLLRFYDPDKGDIYIDGINIRSMDKKKRQEKFGVVFQNDILFADTIYENVSFGRNLREEEVTRALSFSRAEEFVMDDSLGIQKKLTIKGANLSGGQKQRLLIARAVAKHPEILILDDSSSALDYKTEKELRENISKQLKDTTTIIIAQRISSILHADHILVLEEGEIISSGTHEELLSSSLLYKEIYQLQMGGKNHVIS